MFDQLKKKWPFPQERWEEYMGYYHRMEVPARTVLLNEGEVSKKAFLVEKGCLRLWFNHQGKDITFQFFFENEAVSSAESFRKNIPSLFTLETIEPSVVHWVHKKHMDQIIQDMQDHQDSRNFMLNAAFDRQFHYMKHFLSFIRDTPAQRYANLIKEKPQIVKRVPQHYIASYLGITPVSLSRIRNKK